MTKKSSADYQREYRRRLRDQGLVKKEVWILPNNSRLLHEVEKELRTPVSGIESESSFIQLSDTTGGKAVASENRNSWTVESLYMALLERPAFSNGSCSIEVIEGLESSIVITMHEYGDLPIFISSGSEQMLVEAVLFSAEDIKDTAKFNEYVLKTHKYLPLSTISLDTDDLHGDYYHMFGALSSASSINEILLEINTLADNVIQATEAFANFLKFEIAS